MPDIMIITKTYYPEKINCLPEKKNFLSRAGIPSSNQGLAADLIININNTYLLGWRVIQPIVYYLTAPAHYFLPNLIPENFLNVELITLFASTLGHPLDTLINDFSTKNRIFEAFLLDSWASESIEKLNRHFDWWLRKQYGPGTKRFSTGYGRVDMRLNRLIIDDLLKVKEITVLESGVMLPRKTTTCLIGWYHEKK